MSSVQSSFVEVPGYRFFRGDVAGNVRKHGAGLYVSSCISAYQIEVSVDNVAVIYLEQFSIYVASVYRPPSYTLDENLVLADWIRVFSLGKNFILLGDFNLPSLKWCSDGLVAGNMSSTERIFIDAFSVSGLHQWVWEGTFFPSGNTLDLIFTSDREAVVELTSFAPLPRCHHCPVVFKLVAHVVVGDAADEVIKLWG